MAGLSRRLQVIVDALPLRPGMRVIEVGCGPGAAAREVARRVGPDGHVLALDRSATAIRQLVEASHDLIEAGVLTARHVACEELVLHSGERPYDLAFAVRVGAFDGRHPEAGRRALERLAAALTAGGELYIDGGTPLRRIALPRPASPAGAAALRRRDDASSQPVDLPRIGAPATRALAAIGVTRLEQLADRSDAELLALHGFGPRALRIIREALAGSRPTSPAASGC